jgi:hypothetical protein
MNAIVKESILDPIVHERLILDLPGFSETANIPSSYVHTSMSKYCTPADMDYVRNFLKYRAENVAGLCLSGQNSETRCMAITGAFVRNFIDARFVTLNQIIDGAKDQSLVDPTVMVIPNLFVQTEGKALTSWQIQSIYDVLLSRYTRNRPTVVYVQDLGALGYAYGALIQSHLTDHFILSK